MGDLVPILPLHWGIFLGLSRSQILLEKNANQGIVVCPYFKGWKSPYIVGAFYYSPLVGHAFQFNGGVPCLSRSERS